MAVIHLNVAAPDSKPDQTWPKDYLFDILLFCLPQHSWDVKGSSRHVFMLIANVFLTNGLIPIFHMGSLSFASNISLYYMVDLEG
ncbi:hypothetical protein ACJX0J_039441, partial [Zea mays]